LEESLASHDEQLRIIRRYADQLEVLVTWYETQFPHARPPQSTGRRLVPARQVAPPMRGIRRVALQAQRVPAGPMQLPAPIPERSPSPESVSPEPVEAGPGEMEQQRRAIALKSSQVSKLQTQLDGATFQLDTLRRAYEELLELQRRCQQDLAEVCVAEIAVVQKTDAGVLGAHAARSQAARSRHNALAAAGNAGKGCSHSEPRRTAQVATGRAGRCTRRRPVQHPCGRTLTSSCSASTDVRRHTRKRSA
jgi:hypothetical protein